MGYIRRRNTLARTLRLPAKLVKRDFPENLAAQGRFHTIAIDEAKRASAEAG